MDELENQEFSLEDILQEFGNSPEETPETPAEAEDIVQEDILVPEAEDDDMTVLDDSLAEELSLEITRVIDLPVKITDEEEGVTSDTIRMDTVRFAKAEPKNAEPIEEEELPVVEEAAPQEEEEAFSEGWEPEYEQPIAEYAPPRPILIHPRSHMKELKAKLVAGPEKVYYKLLEKGLGKLQAAIFFSLIVVLLSAAATIMDTAGMIGAHRMKLMVFCQFMAMLVAALLGSFQLIDGVIDLVKKRFSLNTMLVFTFIFCCADAIVCLYRVPQVADPRVPCCAAFSLQMIMSLWSTYQKRNTAMGQMDTLRKASHLEGISVVEDYCEGERGLLRGEGRLEDFMDNYYKPSSLDKVISVYAIVATCLSVVLGVVAGVLRGLDAGIQVAAVTTLAAVPASMFVTLSRPMAVLEKRLHRLGAVLCGWMGVNGLCKKAMFPLDREDLCPTGSVKLNGVKFYGDRDSDEVIAYCAALCNVDGGALAPVFEQLLESRNGIYYEVANYRDYGTGGIGGEVNAEPVLVGTLPFLRSMGVDVPESLKVSHAVGVSVDGELCGLFAITYDKIPSSNTGLMTLTSYRGLRPVIVTDDFMLTDSFIRSHFSVNTKRIRFPEQEVRAALRKKAAEEENPTLAISTNQGLAPIAYCVTGAKALKNASRLGTIIHMIGGILGIGVMLTLTLLGALHLLTPANLFLYELVWMVPGLLITEWTRSI